MLVCDRVMDDPEMQRVADVIRAEALAHGGQLYIGDDLVTVDYEIPSPPVRRRGAGFLDELFDQDNRNRG